MNNLILALFLAFVSASIGCGTQTTVNTNTGNTNLAATTNNQNAPAAIATPNEKVEVGSLATPEDAYRTAYALREKKDIAGLKRTMSKDVIEFLTMMAEDEKKSLDEEIATMFEKPQAKTNEFRNVKISGDRASLEYPDDKGTWKTMDFVKENGEWKMAFPPKEDVQIETSAPGKKGKN